MGTKGREKQRERAFPRFRLHCGQRPVSLAVGAVLGLRAPLPRDLLRLAAHLGPLLRGQLLPGQLLRLQLHESPDSHMLLPRHALKEPVGLMA